MQNDSLMLSIIIPVVRIASNFDACISSLLAQTYEKFEILFIDGGTSEQYSKMCAAWMERDKHIRVVSSKSSNIQYCYRAGLLAAKGKYIAFPDLRDTIHQDFYYRIVCAMRIQDADAGGGGFSENSHVLQEEKIVSLTRERAQQAAFSILPDGQFLSTSLHDKVFRRDCIPQSGKIDLFTILMSINCFVVLPGLGYYYRDERKDMDIIVGAVTIYYPDTDVVENLRSYVDNLDELILLDNTPEPDCAFREQVEKWGHIRYIARKENRGIADALNEAFNIADGRYQWMLTMDQDSSFPKENFREYLAQLPIVYKKYPNVFALGATAENDPIRPRYEEVSECITSGTLNLVPFAKKIGGLRSDFFIDEVDFEYCYRGRTAGGVVVRYGIPVMKHHVGASFTVRILGRSFICWNEKYFRCYYMARNRCYIMRDYPSERIRYLNGFIRWVIKILLAESDRWRKLRYIIKGIRAFWHGETGRLKE